MDRLAQAHNGSGSVWVFAIAHRLRRGQTGCWKNRFARNTQFAGAKARFSLCV